MLQPNQVIAILFETIKYLKAKKQICIIYIERNNHNYTYLVTYLHKIIDYIYSTLNVKDNWPVKKYLVFLKRGQFLQIRYLKPGFLISNIT